MHHTDGEPIKTTFFSPMPLSNIYIYVNSFSGNAITDPIQFHRLAASWEVNLYSPLGVIIIIANILGNKGDLLIFIEVVVLPCVDFGLPPSYWDPNKSQETQK